MSAFQAVRGFSKPSRVLRESPEQRRGAFTDTTRQALLAPSRIRRHHRVHCISQDSDTDLKHRYHVGVPDIPRFGRKRGDVNICALPICLALETLEWVERGAEIRANSPPSLCYVRKTVTVTENRRMTPMEKYLQHHRRTKRARTSLATANSTRGRLTDIRHYGICIAFGAYYRAQRTRRFIRQKWIRHGAIAMRALNSRTDRLQVHSRQ